MARAYHLVLAQKFVDSEFEIAWWNYLMNSIFVRLLSNLEFLLTDHTRILLKRNYLSQNLLKNFEMFLHDFFGQDFWLIGLIL